MLSDDGGTANGGDDTYTTQTFTITVTPVNDEPSFTKGADETVLEDAGAQTVNGWATALDKGATNESGQTLSFAVTNDNNSLFSVQPAIDATGNLTYTPAADANGSATVSVVLSDDGGTANGGDDTYATQTFTITVDDVNDAPIATDDTQTTDEDNALSTNVPAATDLDGTIASYTLVTDVTNGTLTFNPDGTYTFDPNGDFESLKNGESEDVTFTYYATDDDGDDSGTQTVTITVNGVNDNPVAVDDSNSMNEDETLTVDATSGLLSNDTDVEGDALVVSTFEIGGTTYNAGETASLTEGDLTINADGSYEFIPTTDFNGAIPAITYAISDGNGGTDTAGLTLTVNAQNDAPVAVDDSNTTNEDETLTVGVADGLLDNDSDLDGDALTISQFEVNGTVYTAGTSADLTEGTLTINADGSYEFIPSADYNGIVPTVTYTVSDGSLTDTGDLVITVASVNDAPVATDDSNSIEEDETLTVSAAEGLLSNDSDTEGDDLSITQFEIDGTVYTAGTTVELMEGTLTINADGSYTFVPSEDFNGALPTVTYTVSDGSLTDTGSLTISVDAVNDAPDATDDNGSINEDETLVVSETDGLLSNDSDLDGDDLSITQFEIDGTVYTAGTTVELSEGTLTINADGSYTLVPASDFNGTLPAITYTVSDGDLTDTGDLVISITPINDAPVATGETVTVESGDTLSEILEDLVSDVDGDDLTYTLISDVSSGTLTLNPDGTYSYLPSSGFFGETTFTYSVCDNGTPELCDQATITIVVTPTDTDDDGISDDDEDVDGDGDPNNDDTDGDGTPDYQDDDSDNDGISDEEEGDTDSDGDGTPDYRDEDSDDDGISDAEEGNEDPDGDGVPNYLDDDSDGDGIPDSEEGNEDPDGDGIPNYLDEDSDGDGIPDAEEGDVDSDGDGDSDYVDLDSDNDGIPDADEGNEDPDGDGVPNYLDDDSDGDGIPDSEEGDSDPDGDGNPNYLDEDSDGDGLPDSEEGDIDTDGDGDSDYVDLDSDGDGIPDAEEDSSSETDCDGDGIPNHLDPYSCEQLPTNDIFTPNFDGFNDEMIIEGIENFPNNSVKIFNRWGNLVWEAERYDNRSTVFSGIANSGVAVRNGSQLPDGTYFFIIDFKDERRAIQKGYITIKR